MTHTDDTRDYGYPTDLPHGAVQVGPKVCYTWGDGIRSIENLLVWHWCDHNIWTTKPGFNPDYLPYEGWNPGGVQAHDLVQVEPLTLSPSIFWVSCCGLHGFLRDDVWSDV